MSQCLSNLKHDVYSHVYTIQLLHSRDYEFRRAGSTNRSCWNLANVDETYSESSNMR
jgi:hypothetical protein